MAVEKVNTEAPLTIEALFKLFMEQQKEAAASNRALAEAIKESRVPYVDPRVIADREQRRKDRKMLVDQKLREIRLNKKLCSHLNEGGKLNIKWMQHSNGIILGVCGNCQSQFDATHNPEDAQLLRRDPKSIRNMGRAGEHARRGVIVAGAVDIPA